MRASQGRRWYKSEASFDRVRQHDVREHQRVHLVAEQRQLRDGEHDLGRQEDPVVVEGSERELLRARQENCSTSSRCVTRLVGCRRCSTAKSCAHAPSTCSRACPEMSSFMRERGTGPLSTSTAVK